MSILNDSLLVDVVDAYDLIKSYNEQVKSAKQSDQLANLIISLTETSNPVIVILYPWRLKMRDVFGQSLTFMNRHSGSHLIRIQSSHKGTVIPSLGHPGRKIT